MTRTEHTKTVRTTFHGNCNGIGHGAQFTERVRTPKQGNRAFRRNNKKACKAMM